MGREDEDEDTEVGTVGLGESELTLLLLFFSFLLGHYFVDVVKVFLTTNAIFLSPFAVYLLLAILVSSQCQYCFQYFCCHMAAVRLLLIYLCSFPICPCSFSTALLKVCCGC